MNKYYCNFQRTENKSSISVECESYEDAEMYAMRLVDSPVINIRVTPQPLYDEVFAK